MENQNLEYTQRRVKEEPPVEFVLILPRPTFGWPALKQQNDVKLKWWVKSVELTKFDTKRQSESKLFQTFFTCPHCQLVTSQRYLTRHLKLEACSKIGSRGFECDFCGKKYQMKNLLGRHMLKHLSERKFRCTKCGFGFKSKPGLLQHERSEMTYKCAVCDVKFSCMLLLQRHRNDFHGNVFECDKCSYQTKFKENFISHKKSHDKLIACETCQKMFSSNPPLKLHQMQHKHGIYATAPEETFDCDICEKSYSNSVYLKKHQGNVHDENEVKCRDCEKVFNNRHYLLLRHRRTHDKAECSFCNRKISKNEMARRSLKNHQMQHRHGTYATTPEETFGCDKCGKSFSSPDYLQRHQRKVHDENKLKCGVCDKTFKNRDLLRQHTQTHAKVECSICRKMFTKYRIASHLRSHSAENHFKCDLCDYSAKMKETLKKHIQTRHLLLLRKLVKHKSSAATCENQFKCVKCEKSFATPIVLQRHMKNVHTKKRFGCQICKKDFRNKFCLNRHTATIHSTLQ